MKKTLPATLLGATLLGATLLGATLLGGTGYAAIQQAPGRGDPMMHADANGDGILTRQEAQTGADARFAKLDTNKDGQISAEEHRAGGPHHRGMPKQGGPDTGKRAAFHQQMLARFDADKDGKLSDAERQAARQAWQTKHPEGGRGPDRKPSIDANGDGAISLAEMRVMATAALDHVDANHDGKIDKAERDAAHAGMKAQHGRHHAPHGGPAPEAN